MAPATKKRRIPSFRYLKRLGSGLVKGLAVTTVHLGRRPVTRVYPEAKAYSPERFRGIHNLVAEECIVCQACARICPTQCFTIVGHRGADRRFILEQFDIDYNRCMFCNLCVEVCPPKCLTMGNEFEVGVNDRVSLIFHVDELKVER